MITKTKRVFLYDIECFMNFFSLYFIGLKGEEKVFIIHESKNQLVELIDFLQNEVKSMIGYNNLRYDYPIVHYILDDLQFHQEMFDEPEYINHLLYCKSQELINRQDNFIPVQFWQVKIPQLDLFELNHFSNSNNRCSLKQLQFVMRSQNVEDLDIPWDMPVNDSDIPKILKYNRNDVITTGEFFNYSKGLLSIRKDIAELYKDTHKNVDWLNCNDSKLGTEIFAVPLANSLNITVQELKKLRTHRSRIFIKDLIPKYIKFETEDFISLLKDFKSQTITTTKKPFEFKRIYNNVEYTYAVGGLHGCIKAGKYYSSKEYEIVDVDVASFYPNIGIVNKLYPQHLSSKFCEIYKGIYDKRLECKNLAKQGIDKEQNLLLVSVYKLLLNSVYGKSNDEYSYFLDTSYTIATTCTGQLVLTMLIEKLSLSIESLQMLQANTDGITFLVKRVDKSKVLEICKKWESITKLELEYSNYKSLIVRDTNNYLAVKDGELKEGQPKLNFYDNSYTQHKTIGCFEVVKTKNGKVSYSKNWSKVIVQKAIYNYYINGIEPRDTILNSTDIFDFCCMYKASVSPKDGGKLEGHMYYNNGQIDKMTKITRYYISKHGAKFVKINSVTKKRDNIVKGYRCTVFNKFIKKEIYEYDIDYSYYIAEANKIINVIENKFQLKLDL